MADALQSAIYRGHVMHHRTQPTRHRFVYRVFALCLDLDELTRLDNQLRWFSLNRFNLFSFHETDHGAGKPGLKQHIGKLLEARGYPEATAHIKLLCYPRILGYVFNPLSVYFCYDRQHRLQVILYEVSNTFGQRHSYLLPIDQHDPSTWVRQQSDKQMYVSPFMPMATRYRFRILPPNDQRIALCIQQDQCENTATEAHRLFATFTGHHQPIDRHSLLSLFFHYPLMTLKVMGGINWEALQLWLKGLKLQVRHNQKTASGISWQDKNGVIHHERL